MSLTNDEKKAYNADESKQNARRELIYRILDLSEMKYLKQFYPTEWDLLFTYLCQESYILQGQENLQGFYKNVFLMLKTIFPRKNFDWEIKRNLTSLSH